MSVGQVVGVFGQRSFFSFVLQIGQFEFFGEDPAELIRIGFDFMNGSLAVAGSGSPLSIVPDRLFADDLTILPLPLTAIERIFTSFSPVAVFGHGHRIMQEFFFHRGGNHNYSFIIFAAGFHHLAKTDLTGEPIFLPLLVPGHQIIERAGRRQGGQVQNRRQRPGLRVVVVVKGTNRLRGWRR